MAAASSALAGMACVLPLICATTTPSGSEAFKLLNLSRRKVNSSRILSDVASADRRSRRDRSSLDEGEEKTSIVIGTVAAQAATWAVFNTLGVLFDDDEAPNSNATISNKVVRST